MGLYNRIWIEKEPVGSGCCAQVYHGWVDEHEVAIKVVHPTMERNLELDLMVISAGARFISWVFPSTSWLNLGAVIKEFETLMMGQTDMRQEAANLDKFRNNFSENPDIVFPEPLSGLCRRRVLFETWIDGEPIAHFLKPSVDIGLRQRLAGLGIDMLLQMVFHDNYWHGDLHPGNLLVTTEGRLAVLDTGIAANLEEQDRDSLAKTFLAVVRGDGARVGQLFLERSFHQCEDKAAFLAEMEEIVTTARSQQLCLERVDVSVLLHKVFSTLMMHKVQLKASFSSVVIAIAIVEGLGRSLDSNLDLVTKALPYILRGAGES